MLVLARKIEESVVVLGAGGLEPMLRVTILESRGGCVRLGFEAGADVLIHRSEVWQRIRGHEPPACLEIGPTVPVV